MKCTVTLPKYATLIRPSFEKKLDQIGCKTEPLSLADEEAYLRTRAFQGLSRQMDQAMEEALVRTLNGSFHVALNQLLEQVTPQEDDEPARKRARVTSEESERITTCGSLEVATDAGGDDAAKVTTKESTDRKSPSDRFTLEPCTLFNPLLLPILFLEGPSYGVDRNNWMNHLVQTTRKQRQRSNVVWLRPTPGLDLTLQEELLRQCLTKEPHLSSKLRKKSFLERASVTDTLLEWASTTKAYDDIVVFLQFERGDDFYSDVLQDFCHWMAERRALEGLPLAVVSLGPQVGRRPLDLLSSTQGPVGTLVKRLSLPSSSEVLDAFWECLFLDREFPLAFPPTVLDSLHRIYKHVNGSAVHVVMKLKIVLAHIFCTKGSFVMTSRKSIPEYERDHIQWFLINKEAKEVYLGSGNSAMTTRTLNDWIDLADGKRQLGIMALQVMHCLEQQNRPSTPTLFLDAEKVSTLDQTMETKDKVRLLKLLERFRRQLETHERSSEKRKAFTHQHNETKVAINRLIIFTDQCEKFRDMVKCVKSYIDEWTSNYFFPSDQSSFSATSTILEVLNTQPRQHAMRGLLIFSDYSQPASDTSITQAPNLVKSVGRMYKLIQDRVAVLQSEWFSMFQQTFALEMTNEEALKAFAYGIYHLKVCGLLQEKRIHQKNDVRYERPLLVWCSQ